MVTVTWQDTEKVFGAKFINLDISLRGDERSKLVKAIVWEAEIVQLPGSRQRIAKRREIVFSQMWECLDYALSKSRHGLF
jgi:hypothetical protein